MTPRERLIAQRQAQLDREVNVALRLAALYRPVADIALAQARLMLADADLARAAGTVVDTNWVRAWAAENHLDQRIAAAIQRFVIQADPLLAAATQASALGGARDGQQLLTSIGVEPSAMSIDATAAIANALRVGAPLRVLLDELPRAGALRAREALATAIATGRSPRETAVELKTAMGGTLAQALRISRTEQLGAYRRGALARYREHRDVIDGWTWIAQLDGKTCAACVAMHGTIHPLDEEMATHPNCRCSPAPHTIGGDGSGTLNPERGEAWFARQPESTQRRILGPAKFAAYRRGDLQISQLAQPTLHPVWGAGMRETPLRDLGLTPIARQAIAPPVSQVPASAMLELPGRSIHTETVAAVKETAQAIGDLHTVPSSTRPVTVKIGAIEPGVLGRYTPSRREISVSPTSGHPGMTFAHETGHYIDFEALTGNVGRSAVQANSTVVAAWRQAVRSSDAFRRLEETAADTASVDSGFARYMRGYVMSDVELWARSYAQWVAARSKNPRLTSELDGMLADQDIARQWDPDDFEPIAAALDDIFAGQAP